MPLPGGQRQTWLCQAVQPPSGVAPQFHETVHYLYTQKGRYNNILYRICTVVYKFCTAIFTCTKPAQLKKRGDLMRLTLRSVPDDLVEQIDQQLARVNDRKGTNMTRNKFIVAVLTEFFSGDKTSELQRMNNEIEDLLAVLHAHVAAEQVLIATVVNNELSSAKEENHAK